MPVDSNGILVRPTGFGDLSSVLGLASLDEGTLCRSSLINMWAKHKAFRHFNVGFPFDKNQLTPELRSPDRCTQALYAYFGLDIPWFSANDFKTHYSDRWGYNMPRGKANTTLNPTNVDEFFRILDFDGYLHNCPWQLGSFAGRELFTIFNGLLTFPSSTVYANDPINFGLQCCEDPDISAKGLLYPYSFYQEPQADLDLSRFYMGIALLDSGNHLYKITGDQMRAHGPNAERQEAFLSTGVPAGMSDGEFKAIPMLSESQFPTWDSGTGSGHFISLDGAYLTLRKQSSYGALDTVISIVVSSSGVTATFTITNVSNNDVQISGLMSFLLSAGSYGNEPDSGYNAPAYVEPGVFMYISQNWGDSGTVPETNPGYIYLTDWAPDYPVTPPAYLAARDYNPMNDFRSANPNTSNRSVIKPGSAYKVTWSHTFQGVTEDDFGAYSTGAFVLLCIDHFVAGVGNYRYVEIS